MHYETVLTNHDIMIQAATTKRIPGSVNVTLSVRRYDLFKINCTGRRRSEEGGLKPVSPRRGLIIRGMTKAGRDWLESNLEGLGAA